MKTKAISSFFVLFAIVAGLVATTPAAFADHSEVTISTASGSGAPGCDPAWQAMHRAPPAAHQAPADSHTA